MDWHILGMLLGTATAISIIKNGFAIDLYGLPAKRKNAIVATEMSTSCRLM